MDVDVLGTLDRVTRVQAAPDIVNAHDLIQVCSCGLVAEPLDLDGESDLVERVCAALGAHRIAEVV